MKNLLFIIPLFVLVTGCDSPQRGRVPAIYKSSSNNFEATPTPGQTTGTQTGGGSPTSPTGEPGFENCDVSQKYHTVDVGFFGICQSTQDETVFKFNPSLSSSTRTCLIPTYKESNGSSAYIGNPQCTTTTSNQVMTGKLYKDRPGFSNYPLNGLIVMKEPLLPEYFNCMNGYVNWPRNACPNGPTTSYCSYWVPRCPAGGQSNQPCDMEARNYMANICNQFKSRYSSSYIDIRLK